MKLGLQSQALTPVVVDFCIRAQIGSFKSIAPQPIELLWRIKDALPECEFSYRPYFDTQPLDNPKQRALEVYDATMPHLAAFLYKYAAGYNETGLWTQAYDYIAFTIELSRLLRTQGKALLAYSFAWGNPPGFRTEPYEQDPAAWMEGLRQQWAPYCDGLRAVKADGGKLCLNQYKVAGYADMFSIYRHRLVQQVLPPDLKDIEIQLGELGLDGVGAGENGWCGPKWNWTAEQYAAWLLETARAIGKEITHGQIFGCGMYQMWRSFDILGQMVIADAMAQANKEADMPITNPDDFWQTLPHTPIWYPQRSLNEIRWIVIHHDVSGLALPTTEAGEWTYALTLARAALNPDNPHGNLPGIPYHYLIFPSGRWLKVCPLDRAAWHCGVYGDSAGLDENRISIGIAFAGDYGVTAPTARGRATGEWLVNVLKPGLPHYEKVLPHRDIPSAQTICPGNALAMWARGLNAPSSKPTEPVPITVIARIEALEKGQEDLRAVVSAIADDLHQAGL